MEGFGEPLLGEAAAVGVGRIDQVDSEFDGPPKDGVRVLRRAVDDAHRPEPQPPDLEVAPEPERARHAPSAAYTIS